MHRIIITIMSLFLFCSATAYAQSKIPSKSSVPATKAVATPQKKDQAQAPAKLHPILTQIKLYYQSPHTHVGFNTTIKIYPQWKVVVGEVPSRKKDITTYQVQGRVTQITADSATLQLRLIITRNGKQEIMRQPDIVVSTQHASNLLFKDSKRATTINLSIGIDKAGLSGKTKVQQQSSAKTSQAPHPPQNQASLAILNQATANLEETA